MLSVWKFLIRTLSQVGLAIVLAFTFLIMLYAADIGPPSRWAHNVLLSIDQTANAITGGDPDETLSSRFGKWLTEEPKTAWDHIRKGFAYVICPPLDLLNLESDHCIKSVDKEEGKDRVVK